GGCGGRWRWGGWGFRAGRGALAGCSFFSSVFAPAVAAGFFDRPRPPRLPRRRRGLVVLDCPASAAGSGVTGSGASTGAAASVGACSSLVFLLRNQGKRNLLRARALQPPLRRRRRGACAASCGLSGTSD